MPMPEVLLHFSQKWKKVEKSGKKWKKVEKSGKN